MSGFDAVIGLCEPDRDKERRPAARTESALSIGPGFSLAVPEIGDSLGVIPEDELLELSIRLELDDGEGVRNS
jgi:hypothetical protein